MKTLTYLPTLLALTIQVMVNGQTQQNQVREIRIDIMSVNQPVTKEFINSTATMSEVQYNELLNQAKYLKNSAQQLKTEAVNVERQSIQKHIQASELSAVISNKKFIQNRIIILNELSKIITSNYVYFKVNSFNTEADKLIKIARETREEANAQLTIEAKLGEMSNAEEMEILALNKQKQIFDLFEKENIKYNITTKSVVTLQIADSTTNKEFKNDFAIYNNLVSNYDDFKLQDSKLLNLLKEASEMKITAQQLSVVAVNATPNEKTELLNEATLLENDYLSKKIEISNLAAQIAYTKFNKNKNSIAVLINSSKITVELLNKVECLNMQAEQLMKIGKEIREEANAQLTNAAMLGEISNAEEKELLAINKQTESMKILERNSYKISYANN